jgi:hypothetical protein
LLAGIEVLGLTVRAGNCLKVVDIFTLGDLVQRTEKDLYCIPNMGRKSVNEIKEELAKRGLSLRTDTPSITLSATPDMVNSPPHYKSGGIETIDFIEAKKLNYNLGNVVKYITRADLKGNRKQDLEKAMWYLQREINTME